MNDKLDPQDQRVLNSFAYVPERDQALDHNRCFLCGAALSEENRTDEHVFPRWLLGDYCLFDQKMGLPNQTFIKYSALRIPCCSDCNSTHLSQLEADIAEAVRSGPAAVEALDQVRLGLWLSKIYYGLLFKDISLAMDQSEPGSGRLLEPEWLKTYFELHQVLQLVRGTIRLSPGDIPSSVFVFRTLDSEQTELRFDFRDWSLVPFIALRMGPVGVVGCLLDWNSVQTGGTISDVEEARKLRLHPVQFRMIAALLAHWRSRMNRTPKYMIGGGGGERPDELMVMPLGGASGLPIFDEFEPELYANLLSRFTEFDLEQVWDQERGLLWNPLRDSNRNLFQADSIEGVGFKPIM